MARTEDLNRYEAELTNRVGGGCVIKFVGEFDPDLPEREAMRTAAYAELRKTDIPTELIDLVEKFNEQTIVSITLSVSSDGALKPGIKAKKKARSKRLPEFIDLTAADALAFFLRMDLRTLKCIERKRSGAPVRKFGLLPRSMIGEIALDLLDRCQRRNCSPGAYLRHLFRELLNLDVDRRLTANGNAKAWVAFAIARNPKISTRALARSIGVEPSTVSRWRKSPEFKKQIELNAGKTASLTGVGNERSAEDFLCHREDYLAKKKAFAPTEEAASILPSEIAFVCDWPVYFQNGSTARLIYRFCARHRRSAKFREKRSRLTSDIPAASRGRI